MSKKDTVEDLLARPEDSLSECTGTGGILAMLFRKMLFERGVGTNSWVQYMVTYTTDPANKIPHDRKIISSAKSNLQKMMLRPNMTWKTMCKVFRWFRYVRIDIVIIGYDKRGNKYVHQLNNIDIVDTVAEENQGLYSRKETNDETTTE